MKIHIYTDIDTLFGRASRLWMDVLVEAAGHDVEFIDLGTSTDAPLPDVGRCDVNFAGTAPALKAEFVWCGLWGAARDACRAGARINPNIHADPEHTYCDQFRTFESWAAGTAVVSDIFEGGEDFCIEPGVPLVMANLKDMPLACADLLANVPRRQAMVQASQQLLRERFSPAAWQSRMLAMLESVA